MTIDLEELAAVVRLLREAEFSEFRYAKGDVTLLVRRGDLAAAGEQPEAARPHPTPVAPVVSALAPALATAPNSPAAGKSDAAVEGAKVRAPLLGTFYSKPKPGEPPFVKVGDRVEPDTVICIVEVMKLMNSINAGVAGEIAAIHAQDGDLVEFDQPLFTIVEAR